MLRSMPEVSRHPGERGCAPNPLVRNWRCVRCVPVGRKAQSGLDEASHSRAARPVAQCTRSPRILRCYRRFRPRHRIVSHRLPRRRAGPSRPSLPENPAYQRPTRDQSSCATIRANVGWSVHGSPSQRASPAPLVWRELPPVQKSADVGSSGWSLYVAHEGAHPSRASAEQDSMNAHRGQR